MLNIYKNDKIVYKVWNRTIKQSFASYNEAFNFVSSLKTDKNIWIDISVSNLEGNSSFFSTVSITRKGITEDIHACYKNIVYKA